MIKKGPLIFLFLVLTFAGSGQAYQYIPMDLDTSSFWVLDYSWGGANSFQGERVCYVFGDTLINNEKYSRVYCYTTKGLYSLSSYSFGLKTERDYLVREDLGLKKVFINGGLGYIDFNQNVGDTLNVYGSNNTYNRPIDSVTYELYQGGVPRRSQYASHAILNPLFKTIEGVGASHSFPEAAHGEWGFPMVSCKCYSKGGVIRYLKGMPVDSCYKKKKQLPYPDGIKETERYTYAFTFVKNQLDLVCNTSEKLHVELFSMSGQKLFVEDISKRYNKSFAHLPAGIYLFSIRSSKGIQNRKVFIH